MSFVEKIIKIHKSLKISDFHPISGSIILQDDGEGAYIKEWNHETLEKPTDEQLKGN